MSPSPRIAVVCPEPMLRRAMQRVITSRRPHWRVSALADANALAEASQDFDFDVVLCDLVGLSPTELEPLRWLQRLRPEVRCLAYVAPEFLGAPALSGVPQLRCPASMADLVAALERLMGQEGSLAPSSAVRAVGRFEPVTPHRRTFRRARAA